MSIRKALSWGLLAVIAISAIALFAACGGDDSGGNTIGNSVGSNGTTSSGGSSNQTNGGTGSDKEYVATLCKADAKFQDDLTNATKDPSKLTDATAIANAFVTPFQNFADALRKAKVPADFKSYHDAFVKALDDAVNQLKTSPDASSLSDFGSNIPDPPQDITDRLAKAAQGNSDCQKANLDFSNGN